MVESWEEKVVHRRAKWFEETSEQRRLVPSLPVSLRESANLAERLFPEKHEDDS